MSHRRARFFHHLAVANGETADRVIIADPEWSIPRSIGGPGSLAS